MKNVKLNIGYGYSMTLGDSDKDVNPMKEHIQAQARHFIQEGHNVFIVTKKSKEDTLFAAEVYSRATNLGVPVQNVIFTCGAEKVQAIQKNNIDVFLDDDIETITVLRMATAAHVVSVYSRFNNGVDWKTEMEKSVA
jgi:uncharacterized HAD superfamily protein